MIDNFLFIIDNSLSVDKYKKNYLNIINGIINQIKNINCMASVIFFNDRRQYYQVNVNSKQLVNISDDLKPNGMTSFYDSFYYIIDSMQNVYSQTGQKSPVVIILTDGDDNNSQLLNKDKINEFVKKTKQTGYQYIFLGILESSIKIGKELGFNSVIYYDPAHQSHLAIPSIINELIKSNVPDTDLDITKLSDIMKKVKI